MKRELSFIREGGGGEKRKRKRKDFLTVGARVASCRKNTRERSNTQVHFLFVLISIKKDKKRYSCFVYSVLDLIEKKISGVCVTIDTRKKRKER